MPIRLRDATDGGEPLPIDHAVRNILARVGESGFAWIDGPLHEIDFERICAGMGHLELRTEIRVSAELTRLQQESRKAAKARPGVYQAEALDFHTDRPTASYLGWYCKVQDEHAGESLLLSLKDIQERLPSEVLKTLGEIRTAFMVPRQDGGENLYGAALAQPHPDGCLIFYVPWNLPETLTESQRAALDAFEAYVRDKRQKELLKIRLQPGQALFIDNRRVLHARADLPPDSRRHLVRFYINSTGRRPEEV